MRLQMFKKNLNQHTDTLSHFFNVLILIVAIIGLAQVVSVGVGDPVLPRMFDFDQYGNGHQKVLYRYDSTAFLSGQHDKVSQDTYWASLQSTIAILQVTNPDVTMWLDTLRRQDKVRFRLMRVQQRIWGSRVQASFNVFTGKLHIGESFWRMRNGDRAAILVHEFVHDRQSRIKIFADVMTELLAGRLGEYGSRLEDEAHLYQWECYRAMNMPPIRITDYLRRRNLLHYSRAVNGLASVR